MEQIINSHILHSIGGQWYTMVDVLVHVCGMLTTSCFHKGDKRMPDLHFIINRDNQFFYQIILLLYFSSQS